MISHEEDSEKKEEETRRKKEREKEKTLNELGAQKLQIGGKFLAVDRAQKAIF